MRVASWVPPPENAMTPFGAMTSNLNGPLKVSPAWFGVTVERATTGPAGLPSWSKMTVSHVTANVRSHRPTTARPPLFGKGCTAHSRGPYGAGGQAVGGLRTAAKMHLPVGQIGSLPTRLHACKQLGIRNPNSCALVEPGVYLPGSAVPHKITAARVGAGR